MKYGLEYILHSETLDNFIIPIENISSIVLSTEYRLQGENVLITVPIL